MSQQALHMGVVKSPVCNEYSAWYWASRGTSPPFVPRWETRGCPGGITLRFCEGLQSPPQSI